MEINEDNNLPKDEETIVKKGRTKQVVNHQPEIFKLKNGKTIQAVSPQLKEFLKEKGLKPESNN